MGVWIAFFRGINVGGNNILPMKGLSSLLQEAGSTDITTYIQSGNAVFRNTKKQAPELAERISASVAKQYGFKPKLLLLNRDELEKAIVANPFPKAQAEPKTLHLYFLAAVPTAPKTAELNRIKSGSEDFAIAGKVFYLYTPDGVGRSKLATKAEALIGVDATARNWNTVSKMLELAKRLG